MFSDWIIISYKKNVKQEEDGHCKNDQLTCIEGVIFFVKEKANQILENGGKRYAIPITIPQAKRHEWAQSVADEVGIEVLADVAGGGVPQQSAIPQTLSRAWG